MPSPTYQSGFYSPRRGGVAKYPSLWRGCISAWYPGLGAVGLRLFDNSVQGRNGSLTGPPTWEVKESGHAMYFSNSYVTIQDFAKVYPAKEITISMWYAVKTAPSGSFYTSTILSCQSSGGSYPGFDVRGKSATEYEVSISIGGSERKVALGAFVLNKMSHMVFVYDGANCRVSRDGLLLSTTAITGGLDTAPHNTLRIGDNPTFTTRYFNGYVDDVRIYNRACSQQEVELLARRRGIAYELNRSPIVSAPVPLIGAMTCNNFLAATVAGSPVSSYTLNALLARTVS